MAAVPSLLIAWGLLDALYRWAHELLGPTNTLETVAYMMHAWLWGVYIHLLEWYPANKLMQVAA